MNYPDLLTLMNLAGMNLKRVTFNFSNMTFFFGDDKSRAFTIPPKNPRRRTQRKRASFTLTVSCDGEFTQAWDTAGAGLEAYDGESLT
jgi:hypothetical protein